MSHRSILLIFLLAVGLTVLFWFPLWQGSGLIGGDLYSYFFPQKTVYADQLSRGELPLWNRLVGFGYPLLAESQAGVFYPSNQLLYRLLDVNTAYNVGQLGHYVLAFLFTWMLMRRLGLSAWGAGLGAVVFVYGWFPPRICLEWAIIGGVYLPFCLWCAESYLQSERIGWLLALAAALAVQLLAGHFNLAFITQLTVLGYVALRRRIPGQSISGSGASGRTGTPTDRPGSVTPPSSRAAVAVVPVACAIIGSFALAAVQILPTWELKQLSQRDEVGPVHDPGYGHIPPWYLSQIVAPWLWYSADVDPDQALNSIKTASIPSATNKVEAHLYFGMVPLLLIVYRLATAVRGSHPLDRRHLCLFVLGLAAMIYSTGWLLPISRHLPGFSFFMGPGRYGIVTTLAAGLLAGSGLDQLVSVKSGHVLTFPRMLLMSLILGLTLWDLHWVSQRITYAVMIPDPPITHREQSAVAQVLLKYQRGDDHVRPVRLWAPGANVPTLTGFSATPVYLGLGPAAYFDPALKMPEPDPDSPSVEQRETRKRQRDWLHEAAVTHLLRMEPLPAGDWPEAQLVWQGFDPLLSAAWGRFQQPLFLYELAEPGRFARIRGGQPGDQVRLTGLDPDFVEMEVSITGEGASVTIAQLSYPGWSVSIDGEPYSTGSDGPFLSVPVPAGDHRVQWRFAPTSVRAGTVMSLIAWAAWAASMGTLLLRRSSRRSSSSSNKTDHDGGRGNDRK